MVLRRHPALVAAALVGLTGFGLTRAGVITPPDLEHVLTELSDTLGAWTYALVGGLAFLETGAFVGLVAPGETAIVLGGVVAAQGGVWLPVFLVIAWRAAAAGALPRDPRGRRLGRRFLLRHGPRFGITEPRLQTVDRFFARHGGKAIVIGRFVGIVRAVAPFTAGAARLPFREFLPWSLVGTAVWASAFTVLGYVANESFSEAAGALSHGALALAVLAAVVIALHQLRRRRSSAQRSASQARSSSVSSVLASNPRPESV